jgi:hypothetical protein
MSINGGGGWVNGTNLPGQASVAGEEWTRFSAMGLVGGVAGSMKDGMVQREGSPMGVVW